MKQHLKNSTQISLNQQIQINFKSLKLKTIFQSKSEMVFDKVI